MIVEDEPDLPDHVPEEDQGLPGLAFYEEGDDGPEVDNPDQRDEE